MPRAAYGYFCSESKGEIMNNGQRDQYETIGIVKNVIDGGRNPVVVMINRNKRTKEFSFQFGLLRRGHVDSIRYWKEESLLKMASLAKFVSMLVLADQMGAATLSEEILEKAVKDSPFLEMVQKYVPEENKEKFSITLGDRARNR